MAVTLTVILSENTFYDIRDMRFIRFKQYDEILQPMRLREFMCWGGTPWTKAASTGS